MGVARGPAVANFSLDRTATIKADLEVSSKRLRIPVLSATGQQTAACQFDVGGSRVVQS